MTEQPQTTEPQGFLLGRLFVVPLIIVAVIVLCATVVVITFGSISSAKDEPIEQVLARLEAAGGERVGGMLLPRDKEMWQAAQELASRLDRLEAEVPPEAVPEIQARVTALLRSELARTPTDDEPTRQALLFMMMAAARSGAAEAVPLLMDATAHADDAVRQRAVGALAAMGDVPAARARAGQLLPLLDDTSSAVQSVTAVALASLATASDTAVVEALLRCCRQLDARELRWNSALTLARLGVGDPTVVMVLDDLLQRTFWEQQQVQYTAGDGSTVRRAFTRAEIDQRLLAVVDAAVQLDDETVWQRITALGSDVASAVAGRARTALQEHAVGALAPTGG